MNETQMRTIVHIGFHKTGTSLIQHYLLKHQATLTRKGVHVIPHRKLRKNVTNLSIKLQESSIEGPSETEVREFIRAFLEEEKSKAGKSLILFDENIPGHCGQIVKRGRLYPRFGRYLHSFNSVLPFPATEIHMAVRSYDSFYSSVYGEYLRSFLPNAPRLVRPDEFAHRIYDSPHGWPEQIRKTLSKFRESRPVLSYFEELKKDWLPYLSGFCGLDLTVDGLNELPSDQAKRTGMTREAVEKIISVFETEGPDVAASRRAEIQNEFASSGNKFTIWTREQAKNLEERYKRDSDEINGLIEEKLKAARLASLVPQSTAPPLWESKSIDLHIGVQKTATTRFQNVLHTNKDTLRRNGMRYIPHRYFRNDVTKPLQILRLHKMGEGYKIPESDEELRARVRNAFAEFATYKESHLILSDENTLGFSGHALRTGLLFSRKSAFLDELQKNLPIAPSRILLSIRNYEDFYSSLYGQFLADANSERFISHRDAKALVLKKYPNWNSLIDTVCKFFPTSEVIVWTHEYYRKNEKPVFEAIWGRKIAKEIVYASQCLKPLPRRRVTQEAFDAFLEAIENIGLDAALSDFADIRAQFPAGSNREPMTIWAEDEAAQMRRRYAVHLKAIRKRQDIRFLG